MTLQKISVTDTMRLFNESPVEIMTMDTAEFHKLDQMLMDVLAEARRDLMYAIHSVVHGAGEGSFVAAQNPRMVQREDGGFSIVCSPPTVHTDFHEALAESGFLGCVYTLADREVVRVVMRDPEFDD